MVIKTTSDAATGFFNFIEHFELLPAMRGNGAGGIAMGWFITVMTGALIALIGYMIWQENNQK
ncbi:hypothetical protein [Ochrobactrum sp. Marseille-Q0166]|uniref:hypothetical protein n=1 Tax=Ochrobactrum sp. Marseille-Q0166 TaxID=2761105 RepID=UPI0016559A08|nr:hypothetical protein [Ochrobactrum sp. Marseille-Q0166]MBC8718764.1 hypothetical protein [Ochrobactrum sp. Marseille-Q0166]